ncbi:MAG: hypothetical protein IKU15_00265 [Clostridia bacterium]|nr:hypothetical protein [Clostridia bacterium]
MENEVTAYARKAQDKDGCFNCLYLDEPKCPFHSQGIHYIELTGRYIAKCSKHTTNEQLSLLEDNYGKE